MAQYKCYRCMKTFEAPGPYPSAAKAGSCKFCKSMVTDQVNLVPAVPSGRQRSNSAPPAFAPVVSGFVVNLHNDNPPLTGTAAAVKLDAIVFRGSRVAYSDLHGDFAPPADGRFDRPWIIRDKWADKKVNSHMQTKAALAWSKSVNKALEYVMGSITGGAAYFYVGWIEFGVDVLSAVRAWEAANRMLLKPPISAGTQEEVLCASLPINRIVACWKIASAGGYPNIQFVEKIAVRHADIPEHVLTKYAPIEAAIEKAFPLNKAVDYSTAIG